MRTLSRLGPAVFIIGLTACGGGSPDVDQGQAAEDIMQVLMEQQAAWNQGDIETFMESYLRSDSLRFASGGSVRYGWDSTLARYHRSYPDRASMGELTFSDIDVDLIAPGMAMVFGRWHLVRTGDYDDIGGLYTLVLEQRGNRWVIISDHTSQAAP